MSVLLSLSVDAALVLGKNNGVFPVVDRNLSVGTTV